jgi:UDP-MurNAc hydroxylase
MELEFVCHASVIVRTPGTAIWTDPWLFGKAFNDSWALLPEPSFDLQRLDEIDYLWVSHEHPDHFHIPTLRSLPVEFKRRVCVLFQDLTSTKMIDAFRRLGFEQIRTLRHREPVALDPNTTVYCYQVGQMDSCLAVTSGGKTVLNINDAEVSPRDLAILRSDLG